MVGQELSTIDQAHGRYYIVGFNATTEKVNLVGWDLKTHELYVDTELDLSESAFVVCVSENMFAGDHLWC